MQPNTEWTEVINGLKYSVEKAAVIAHDEYWDGSNMERSGRNCWLYRTPNGNYFKCNLTQWQGERDSLTPLSQDEALELWEVLPEKQGSFEDAFPGVEIKEA